MKLLEKLVMAEVNKTLEKGEAFYLNEITDMEHGINYPLSIIKATKKNPVVVTAEQDGCIGVEYDEETQEYLAFEGIILDWGNGTMELWDTIENLVSHINDNCYYDEEE